MKDIRAWEATELCGIRKQMPNVNNVGMHEGDPILRVDNASVTFDMDRGRSRVLDDVSIEVNRGEVLGIVGESGSGKSMFAAALLDAVVDPGHTRGTITYYRDDGQEVDVLSMGDEELRTFRWEEVAMVFQGSMSSWNPTMKIRGHFKETLQHHDHDVNAGMERARQFMADVHLDPDRVLNSYPHELSGGMKQRALIALSLLLEPDVLVMDEPTAALDLLMQRSILRLLREIRTKYDITLIFITHDLPLVVKLADRLAVMYAFQFVEVGSVERIVLEAAHPYTRSLLNATPSLEIDLSLMRPIEGSSPDPVEMPTGCSYHPRCPLATEECIASEPSLDAIHDTQRVACYHWDRTRSEIPLITREGNGS